MLIDTAIDASAAAISSSAMRYVSVSSPIPSYSSGVVMPRKPSRPSSSIPSRAKCLVRSPSAANGSIFSRANSRASSTTWSCSVAVGIEPLPALPAQATRGHHLPEQRRRPVLVVAQPVVQHLEDREAYVQTDQVGQRERTERMIHAELHHLVHGLRSGH